MPDDTTRAPRIRRNTRSRRLVASSIAAAMLLATCLLTIRRPAALVYRPLPNEPSPQEGTILSARRSIRLVGVVRRLCPSAGQDVLAFAPDGTGTADFAWTDDRDTPASRVWARVRRTGEAREARMALTRPDGQPNAAVAATAPQGEWEWLDLGTIHSGEQPTARLRVAGLGSAAWELMELRVTPATGPPPSPPLTLADGRAFREFGDQFDRSPGHGLGLWQRRSGIWEIEFSLDPNRIPMQYSLRAGTVPGEKQGLILADAPPWLGTRTAASVLLEPGGEGGIAIETEAGTERYLVHAREDGERDRRVAPHQWHRLVLEAWGWTRRLLVDGREVAARHDSSPAPHRPGLAIAVGQARFDDVRISEIAWCADDARAYRMPWRTAEAARWSMLAQGRGAAFKGQAGALLAPAGMAPVREIVLWGDHPPAIWFGGTFEPAPFPGGAAYRSATASTDWRLVAPGAFDRIAACAYPDEPGKEFRMGPYRFDSPTEPDPSDYLDFTPEEWEAIRTSPEADKLARKPKHIQVVGRSSEYAIWATEFGRWQVADGTLLCRRGGRVRFWQELEGAYTLALRVRLDTTGSSARVRLGEGDGTGVPVLFHAGSPRVPPDGLALEIRPDRWTECRIALADGTVTATVRDGGSSWSEPLSRPVARGIGGGLLLEAEGRDIAFDDIEIAVPRHAHGQRFHAFDRRETEWLRDGPHWIDHGGISCALASNWVSLVAPEGGGMLWHKASFSGNVFLATNVEENTEWIGWEEDPSHVHHPFDNIVLCLAAGHDPESGYRLEVNSLERSATVLYRAGREVARIPQDRDFPMQYNGGHSPYSPRRNRLALVRQGSRIRGLVNGVEVLAYLDAQPLPTDSVGIGGYRTRANFSRIMLRELGTEQ